jgi:ribulose-phosphate 3-epimerase
MITISASLLAADQDNLLQEVSSLPSSVTSLHLDIEDGVQVSNFGLSMKSIMDLPLAWPKEVHLMVVHPEQFIAPLQDLNVTCFFINISTWGKRMIWNVSSKNIGLVINPSDDIQSNSQSIQEASHILVMGVVPGRSGQSMLPDTVARIQAIKTLNPTAKITVDGGVNAQSAPELIQSGVNQLVVGSYLFKSIDKKKAVEDLLGSA